MLVLKIAELSKKYPGRRGRFVEALQRVSLTLTEGECLGIIGESGSGKSTLARCILRLETPDAGSIDFLERDWLGLKGRFLRRARRDMQAVFQDPYTSLNPYLNVGAIVEEPLLIHGRENSRQRAEQVAELLVKVGLSPDIRHRYPRQFSGGERQRIALARAVICNPRLLIADEPLSALDVSTQGRILELLVGLRSHSELTILFISHSLPVVRNFCDRVAVLYRGCLVESATSEELFSDPLHPYTRFLVSLFAGDAGKEARPRRRHDWGETSGCTFREVRPGHWLLCKESVRN